MIWKRNVDSALFRLWVYKQAMHHKVQPREWNGSRRGAVWQNIWTVTYVDIALDSGVGETAAYHMLMPLGCSQATGSYSCSLHALYYVPFAWFTVHWIMMWLLVRIFSAFLACQLALSLYLSQFILEGDSLKMALSLQKPTLIQDWRISHIISQIMSAIPPTSNWLAKHVNRSANFCAHLVANWTATKFLSSCILNFSFCSYIFLYVLEGNPFLLLWWLKRF